LPLIPKKKAPLIFFNISHCFHYLSNKKERDGEKKKKKTIIRVIMMHKHYQHHKEKLKNEED